MTLAHSITPPADDLNALLSRTDPVTVEIVKGALRATQGEMEVLLERTAMSPIIREKQDYFVGLFDGQGRLLIGTKIPVLGNILGPIFEHYPPETMKPGDLYWYNDCYGSRGGVSHSPDQVFVAPIFADGKLIAFAHSWAHFMDVGGMRAGSTTADATEIFHEGIIIPPVKLYDAGKLNEELFRAFVRNSRFPEMTRGDTRALMAAVRLGERRMVELFELFGQNTLEQCFDVLLAQSESAIRSKLRDIFKPGVYRFADRLDTDGHGHGPITLRMTLTAENDRYVIDATASDDQTRGPVNFLMHPSVPKMIMAIYLLSDDSSLVLNQGALNALDDVLLREGSILQPRFPAPLGQRANTLGRVQSCCFGLIGVALARGEPPREAIASTSIYVFCHIRGQEEDGQPFLKSVGVAVGHGARPYADGIDAVYYVAQQNYPVEFSETTWPVRILRSEINCDSGGPGRFRGGCGVVREIEIIAPEAVVAVRMDNVANPPWGVNGGMSGRSGRFIVNPGRPDERQLKTMEDGVILKRGDVLRMETVGGGGSGHPFDRDPERVLTDVLGGFVGQQSALEDYGVVITEDGTVDGSATEERRRQYRWPVKLFHRGGYYDEDEWYAALAD
jgi:N-methylhydantoinase B